MTRNSAVKRLAAILHFRESAPCLVPPAVLPPVRGRGNLGPAAIAAAACLLLCAPAALAQGRGGGRGGGRGAAAQQPPEEGIPVTDALTISKCASCHAKDDKGNLSRISWIRTTPEGWEEAIKRMVRLNGLTLEPADARAIVKYLSNSHGLAPEEAKPVMYMAEHRIQDEVIPNESVRVTCKNCHALGRAFQWHRTAGGMVAAGGYAHGAVSAGGSGVPPQRRSRRRAPLLHAAAGGRGNGAAAGAATAVPAEPVSLDTTLDFLGKSYGLHTPEWSAWRARMRAPRIAGRWLVSARMPGHGKYFGEMTIAQGAAPDEFTTTVKLQPVNGGPTLTRTGTSLVYTGYSWRGRSHGGAVTANSAPDDINREMREAMWISPDQNWAEGRWFWGEYQEFGVRCEAHQRHRRSGIARRRPVLAEDRLARRSACVSSAPICRRRSLPRISISARA